MKIVVVSPHPDDETLGAAGTLLKYKKSGHQIYWLNITDVKVGPTWTEEFIKKRAEQMESIKQFFDFDGVYNLEFTPAKLGECGKSILIEKISSCFREIQPDWVILPDPNDAHSDHLEVFDACYACTKIFRYPTIKKITTMEIISETDFGKPYDPFVPNYFVDITDYMEAKLEALSLYDTELGEVPFPRNLDTVKALANVRGAAAGCIYAEAFKIIKMID